LEIAGRHEVLFCPDDEALVDSLTRFVAAALNGDDAAIVLVTESHRSRLLHELRAQDVDIDGAVARGTCVFFDADVAPDPETVFEAINSVRVAAARPGKAQPRIAFFGERAGRLWASGRMAEALELERLGGTLAPDVDILCAYPVPYETNDEALALVCGQHTAFAASHPPHHGARDGSPVFRLADDIAVLKRAEEIRAQYAAVVESSQDAIITKDLDGVIGAWNAAAERMFGFTERESIGRPITIIVPPELHEEERDIQKRLRGGERIEHYETVRVTKAGERVDVSLTISPLRDQAGRITGCSKIARDISKAKQAEAALRQSERRLAREVARAKTLQSISTRLISESTPEALYAQILGAAMELMASDFASVQMLAPDQATLKLLASKNFHADSAAFWQVVRVDAGSTCATALRGNRRIVAADVEACAFLAGTPDLDEYRRSGIRAVQSTPLRSRSGRPLGMLSTHWRIPHDPSEEDFRFFDVLARQAADLIERTLAGEAVSQKLIEAHEDERTHIARELHDDLSQRLAVVSVRLGNLLQNPPVSTREFQQEITETYQLVGDLASDVQALSHGLHPPKLELMGLEAAVAGFCGEMSATHDVTIDVRVSDIPRSLPPDISLCLYRIAQEALQNFVKHGGVPRAEVSLLRQSNALNLTVTDYGAGFDLQEAMRGPGLGLTTMTERLKVLGGQLSIDSQPGRGTTVHAIAPLRVPAHHA
jgi:PAS domain S-box-containing protein